MRASALRGGRTIRAALALLVSAVALLAAVGAQADNAVSERNADRLRSENAEIAARSHAVLLELYALESQLARAEQRVAALRAEAAAVERRRESARRRLSLVQRTLEEGEERLALRIRQLYEEGDPDPLAVLLGASSLDDAITSLENLGRFAARDGEIIEQVREARAEVRSALEELGAREDELTRLTADAEQARSALVQARDERSSYLAALLRQQRVNQAELARLAAQAQEIESRSEDVGEDATGGAADPGSGGGSAPPPGAGGRSRMTVESTGYCLRGKTATGIPVGWGVVAVDPSVIPLGTRMTVPGYGEGVAADTGSAVKGAIIDLWFPSCSQAIVWGRRTVTITLH